MDAQIAIVVFAAATIVAIALTPFAWRFVAGATSELSDEFSDEDRDLSRIRRRR